MKTYFVYFSKNNNPASNEWNEKLLKLRDEGLLQHLEIQRIDYYWNKELVGTEKQNIESLLSNVINFNPKIIIQYITLEITKEIKANWFVSSLAEVFVLEESNFRIFRDKIKIYFNCQKLNKKSIYYQHNRKHQHYVITF